MCNERPNIEVGTDKFSRSDPNECIDGIAINNLTKFDVLSLILAKDVVELELLT